jgi:cytochrome P450
VPERDSDALTTALLSLLEHPEQWAAMGEAGRQGGPLSRRTTM